MKQLASKMNLTSKFYQIFSIALLSCAVLIESTKSAHINAIEQQAQHENSLAQRFAAFPAAAQDTRFNVPLLVLMSANEISVAQLPLIDNGSVSVVYRLLASKQNSGTAERNGTSKELLGQEVEDKKAERREEDRSAKKDPSATSSVGVIADAREYEQMPPQSTSLGKSEWLAKEQIASSPKRFITIAGQTENGKEEVGARIRKDEGEEATIVADAGGKETIRPRRSNSLNEHERADLAYESASRGSPTATSVPESSSASGLNVTSARFGGGNERYGERTRFTRATANTAGSVPATATVALEEDKEEEEEEDGDKNGGVKFSDFDVHIYFGYAFVADSRGRIHRFKLDGVGTGNSKGNLPNVASINSDYTNTIDAAPASGVHEYLSLTQADSRELSSSAATNVTGVDDAAAGDDANKVSSQSVTHEQSGPHPSASGPAWTSSISAVSSDGNLQSGARGNAVTSDPPSATNLKRQQLRFNNARPRIIWSRSKNNAPAVAHPAHPSADLALQKQTTAHEVGDAALASESYQSGVSGERKSHHRFNETEGSSQVGANSVNDDTGDRQPPEQMMGEAGENERATGGQPANRLQFPEQETTEQRPGAHLRTEIAIDWLNDLLFVLDKYRLLVVDFEGNNELVLIDDFNRNNRPVDIKVDPANNFLFWLQVGNFHNTIYKLDLNVLSTASERFLANTAKQSAGRLLGSASSELVALISHHYAHPIITNLPRNVRLFTIDHKHSRIYVPLALGESRPGAERNSSIVNSDAEVFGSSSEESNFITHMNSSSKTNQRENEFSSNSYDDINGDHAKQNGQNCSSDSADLGGQVLAYNLDGTDVGPLRNERIPVSGFENMQDITLDCGNGLLYWLTNDGKDLFEEFRNENDSSLYTAQHSFDGKQYSKLMHFDGGSNQPRHLKPRIHLNRLIKMLSISSATNRWIRSDGQVDQFDPETGFASSWNSKQRPMIDSDSSRFSRNAPYIILAVTGLVVIIVYLIYAFVFHGSSARRSNGGNQSGSMDCGSSMGESQSDCDANTTSRSGIGTNTISRWIGRRTPRSSTDTQSNFNRDATQQERVESCDIESTNYNTSNAVDDHYRDILNNPALFELDTNRLVNLTEWPTDFHDLSNKLYVPVEILQDEALSSIRRIAIDQLEIERRTPLGEGHFGTVLQGCIKCNLDERSSLLNKANFGTANCVTVNVSTDVPSFSSFGPIQQKRIPSSTSSGHGSSSTSSEFMTASNCADTSNGDYLTPKSQCTSAMGDYAVGEPHSSRADSYSSYYNSSANQEAKESDNSMAIETKLKVAIKKLKDNASAKEKKDFLQEAKFLSNFNHPNVVSLIGICLDRGSTLIVMELMLGGDLNRYMKENTPRQDNPESLTYDDLLSICLDIVNGCCYLEELKYIHRDLAARNCLVSSRKKEDRVVKLADFGLARDIYNVDYYKNFNDLAMPVKWMAPECFIEQKFTTMSDIWSFGVVMWEVMSFCQEKLYDDLAPCLLKEYLTGGARLSKPDHCSDDIYRLMNECWRLEPENRPTFQECRATLIEIKNRSRD